MEEFDLEKVDGFVIDLNDVDNVYDLLKDILCTDKPKYDIISQWDMWRIREYIINYFIKTYTYIFVKAPNVYQIVEANLYVKE